MLWWLCIPIINYLSLHSPSIHTLMLHFKTHFLPVTMLKYVHEEETIPPEVICIKYKYLKKSLPHTSSILFPKKITQPRNTQMFFQLEIFLALLIFLIGLFIIRKKEGMVWPHITQAKRCDDLKMNIELGKCSTQHPFLVSLEQFPFIQKSNERKCRKSVMVYFWLHFDILWE